MQESEQKFRAFFENEPGYCYMVSPQGKIIDVNKSALNVLGYSKEELVGEELNRIYAPESQEIRAKLFENWKKTGKLQNEELVIVSKTGERRHVLLNVDAVRDEEGNIMHSLSVQLDITERKKAEEQIKKSLSEKEVLLREVHHRVKNNLQIINSLISLQQEHITDKKASASFVDIHNRVMSMAAVHENLYASGTYTEIKLSDYVKPMALNLFNTYNINPKNVSLKTAIDNIPLDVDMAIPCSIIISELISNSLKHAFPNGKGEITIEFHQSTDSNVQLTISDNGVGIPDNIDLDSSKSFGLWLVKILAEQLWGTVLFERDKGTKVKVEFPVKFRIKKDTKI
jgi:PAS domain S-box-containing protein